MNTKFVLIVLLFSSLKCLSQQEFGTGLLPNWNYGIKLNSHWKINGKIESRFNTFETDSSGKMAANPGFELLDVQTGASYKNRPDQSLNLSFLLRYRGGDLYYRSIQQFTIAKELQTFELGQRFRSDQTFDENGFREIRLRYRITFIASLSGQKINAREPYFKLNNEYITGYRSAIFFGEVRLTPGIGYAFNDQNKLEFGADYRLQNLFSANISHQLWLNMGWYYTFQRSKK